MFTLFKPHGGNGRVSGNGLKQPQVEDIRGKDAGSSGSGFAHGELLGLVGLVRHARSLVDAFDGEIQGTVGSAVTEGRQVDAAAAESIAAMARIDDQAGVVSEASREAAANVGTVAAATEELAAGGREVNRLVEQATALAGDAVDKTGHAASTIAALTDASKAISGIIVFIEELARRTNMLALNATIEAQRAGQAGKGFAVVAGEVKDLANQTAAATRDIRDKIAAIQTSAGDAGQAITTIGEAVDHIREINRQVAAAVEQQAQATAEINHSGQAASTRVNEVTESIGAIAEAATGALRQSEVVKKRAETISQRLLDMQDRLGAVLKVSRQSKRTLPRIPVVMAVSAQLGERRIQGELQEIGWDGGRLRPESPIEAGSHSAVVRLPWLGDLPATLTAEAGGDAAIRFGTVDQAKAFRKLLDNLDVLDLWAFGIGGDLHGQVVKALEDGLARGELGLEDLFDEDYQPIPGTNPQQHTSRYLAFFDRRLPDIIEGGLKRDPRIIASVPVDRNGYLATHHRHCSKPQGSDSVWNAANSRNRRILPNLAQASASLAADATEPYTLFTYIREVAAGDKQMLMNLALPIRIKGRYWGILAVTYRP